MDLGLTGKVAIVGGGSDGLGFAIAERLLAEGAHVAFFARRAEKVAAAERRLAERYGEQRVLGLAADCSSAADLERVTASTLERFGDAVHVLVTNDGGPPIRRISELTDEVWLQAFERHFFYVVRSVRADAAAHDGRGRQHPQRRVGGRRASRGRHGRADDGVVGGDRVRADPRTRGRPRQNISVNTLLAGYFDTPLLAKTIERQPELSKERSGERRPLGRIGAPREFADLVATLVSPRLEVRDRHSWPRSTAAPASGWAPVSTPRYPRTKGARS